MKKALSIFLAAAMAFALVACGTPASSSHKITLPDGPIRIGGLAPLTGGVSQYGIASSNGSKIAVEEINAAGGVLGQPINFILLDEKGDATEALTAYNRLIQDKVVALVGDITTKPTIAVAQKSKDDNLPMITPTGTGAAITEIGKNVFRACFTDPYQGKLMANYASEKLGAKTAAILFDTTDDYSEGIAEAFEATAKELGLTITTVEGYENGASDFNAVLTKIKGGNPDVIMIPCYYSDAAKIIVQARGLGIDVPLLGPDGWDSTIGQLDASNLDALNNSFYCSQYALGEPTERLQAFKDAYVAAYGEDAPLNMFAVLGYEAMHIMAAAIEKAGSIDADAIIATMQTLKYDGVSGSIDFSGGQDPVREAYIIEFKDGAEEILGIYTFK